MEDQKNLRVLYAYFSRAKFFLRLQADDSPKIQSWPKIAEGFRGSPDVFNKLALRSTAIYLIIAVSNQKALDRFAIAHI